VASTTLPVPVDDADRAKVPDDVIGEPDIDMNEGTVISTEVTVPDVAGTCHVGTPVAIVRTVPSAPLDSETRFFDASVWRIDDAVKEESWSDVPVAAPRIGVVSVGEVDRTTSPVPVDVNSIINVPVVVIEAFDAPLTVNGAGTDNPTNETLPGVPEIVYHERFPAPSVANNWPDVPVVGGRFKV
jgi:hypothetical protein